jgi:hypothetical protein
MIFGKDDEHSTTRILLKIIEMTSNSRRIVFIIFSEYPSGKLKYHLQLY